jgi:hypothetical protein
MDWPNRQCECGYVYSVHRYACPNCGKFNELVAAHILGGFLLFIALVSLLDFLWKYF